jgi:flagellar protein FlaG
MSVNDTKLQATPTLLNEQASIALQNRNTSGGVTGIDNVEQQKVEETSPFVSEEEVRESVASLNQHMQNLNRSLQFSVDETSGQTVVQVIDADTEELVRQIPAQELIDVKNALDKYRGILFQDIV